MEHLARGARPFLAATRPASAAEPLQYIHLERHGHGAISVGKPSPVLRRLHVARTGVGIGQWWRSEARVGHVGAGVSLLVHDRAYPSKSISTFSVLHFCAQRVSVQPQVVRALL